MTSNNIWKPHLTVASIIEKDGRFLFVEEEIDNNLVINQPAGHLDDGETLINAVIRETKEETAYTFHPEHIVGIYKWSHPVKGKTIIRVTCCGTVSDHNPKQELDTGIVRALWLTPKEIADSNLNIRSPMVIQCMNDYLSGIRYPLDLINEII